MLTQVQVKNFKSIGGAVVDLEPFTAFVGPNGAGKSNFVDALRFVTDCLTNSVDHAFVSRGGVAVVRRKSRSHPKSFGFRLILKLESGMADYAFEVAAERQGGFYVRRERCICGPAHFEARRGVLRVDGVEAVRGKDLWVEPDRLALTLLAGTREFRPVYRAITQFRFYTLNPDRIRELQEPGSGETLKPDGSNAAAVLREIRRKRPDRYDRLCAYLDVIVPGVSSVIYATAGPKQTMQFYQNVGDKRPWLFDAISMSDGTLRVLGILLAAYQVNTPSLLVIEEPEATIHPAALEALLDMLVEGSSLAQVVVTTHSSDLLDHKEISGDVVRVVRSRKGETLIAPLTSELREAVRNRLFTPGELLQSGELDIDETRTEENAGQVNLFEAIHE